MTPSELLMELVPVLGFEIRQHPEVPGSIQFIHVETGKALRVFWTPSAVEGLRHFYGIDGEYEYTMTFVAELFSFASRGKSPIEETAKKHLAQLKPLPEERP